MSKSRGSVRVAPSLPLYGTPATAFPAAWGRFGQEGVVVEFTTEAGRWFGNFERGMRGMEFIGFHPNARDAVVIARGDLWVVRPEEHTAELQFTAIQAAYDVHDPDGWVFDRQGLAFARLGPTGILWHTRRISWDGFDQVTLDKDKVTGLAWSALEDRWFPFQVDLSSGRAAGGSYPVADGSDWEVLAR